MSDYQLVHTVLDLKLERYEQFEFERMLNRMRHRPHHRLTKNQRAWVESILEVRQ